MQPLKCLVFVRIGSANSHKYRVNKKQLRAFRTVCNKISCSWIKVGIEYNLLDWADHKYDNEWSFKAGIQYYKNKVACIQQIDYKDKQEELIDCWIDNNEELLNVFDKLKKYSKFNKDSFHSPPQIRGLYAFPQYRLETFLTHWDDSKFDIKHCKVGTEDESYRKRAKKFVTIKYNKPTLWCHFIKEAKQLKVDIKFRNSWVLINSYDYLKVLALWELNRVKELRNNCYYKDNSPIKHCYQLSSKDDLEVFLIGV